MREGANLVLVLVSVAHGMNHFYQLLLPVAMPAIRDEYGLTYSGAGILVSCFSFSYSILQSLIGLISVKVGKKNLLVMGTAITSLAFMSLGFSTSLLVLALALILAGIGGSMHHPCGMPLIAELFGEKRGQASGFHQTGGSLGSFISPLVAGSVIMSFGWRTGLFVLSIPGVFLALILLTFLVDPGGSGIQTKCVRGSSKEFRTRVIVLIAAAAVYTSAFRGINAFANQYFLDARGLANLGEASFLFSMLQVAGLFSAPMTGRISDKLGRKVVICTLIVIQSISIIGLLSLSAECMVLACIVFGFSSFGLLAITDAYLTDITPIQHAETVFGVHYTVSFIMGAILPPVVGSIIDSAGFTAGFGILSVIILIGIPMIAKISRVE